MSILSLPVLFCLPAYFSGNDPQAWQTDIPTYQKVKYEQVYDGIDLVYYGNQQQLEYDFVVQPGADPNTIRFGFEGVEAMQLNDAGELVLQTVAGEVKQHKPVIYQEVNGSKQEIAGDYVLQADQQISFAVGEYDATLPLTIDPVIQYITYHGTLPAWAIAADKDGNAYVGGQAPASAGAYSSGAGQAITKLNPTGTAVIFSATFATGDGGRIRDLKVDEQGNVYVTGSASTSQFPTTPGAFQTSFGLTGNNFHNAFVMKLNAPGNALIYSTYLKGDQSPPNNPKNNFGKGIIVDKDGNAYVTGSTNALDFPVTVGAFQTQNPSQNGTGFVTKLNASGSSLIYSTYLGSGSGADHCSDIAIDAAGSAYITGITSDGFISQTRPRGLAFPRTPGAFQSPDISDRGGIFVTKLNPTGTGLVYSTLLGTSWYSQTAAPQIQVDAQGSAYVCGTTGSSTFPTTPGAYQTTGGGAGRFTRKP